MVYLESNDAFARELEARVVRNGGPVTFRDDLGRADYICAACLGEEGRFENGVC